MVLAMNIEQLIFQRDLKVVFGQVMRLFEAKEDNMKKYFVLAKGFLSHSKATWFEKIDRRQNQRADKLFKAISGEEITTI